MMMGKEPVDSGCGNIDVQAVRRSQHCQNSRLCSHLLKETLSLTSVRLTSNICHKVNKRRSHLHRRELFHRRCPVREKIRGANWQLIQKHMMRSRTWSIFLWNRKALKTTVSSRSWKTSCQPLIGPQLKRSPKGEFGGHKCDYSVKIRFLIKLNKPCQLNLFLSDLLLLLNFQHLVSLTSLLVQLLALCHILLDLLVQSVNCFQVFSWLVLLISVKSEPGLTTLRCWLAQSASTRREDHLVYYKLHFFALSFF